MFIRTVLISGIIYLLTAFGTAQQVSVRQQEATEGGSHQVSLDAVVMDKKGAYLSGLSAKEFRVIENGSEQTIQSVTEVEATSEPDYLVLLFDQMQVEDQTVARGNSLWLSRAGTNRHRNIAVMSYLGNGVTKVEQGFTTDPEQLARAIKGIKASGVFVENQPVAQLTRERRLDFDPLKNAAPESDSPLRESASSNEFASRSLLWSFDSLVKTLAQLPGHKSIVFFTPGMTLGKNEQDILTAVIESCNRSNVTVYPLQVRIYAALQQPVRTLAAETGGFPIMGNNDLESGLRSIIEDEARRYRISYLSPELQDCHPATIKINVEGGAVRARKKQCSANADNVLAGSAIGKDLEDKLKGGNTGTVKVHMQTPFFYSGRNTARVLVSAEVSTGEMQFSKQHGRFHATLHVMGAANRSDGQIFMKFSDALDFDFNTKEEVERFKQVPYHYSKRFEAPSGRYTLKVIFAPSSEVFGVADSRISVPSYDDNVMALSGIGLSKAFKSASDSQRIETSLVPQQALVSKGVQFELLGNPLFKKDDPATVYFEVYEPKASGSSLPPLQVQLRVIDMESAAVKVDSGMISIASWRQSGQSVVPMALKLALASLSNGYYRVDVRVVDEKGSSTPWRSAEFAVE